MKDITWTHHSRERYHENQLVDGGIFVDAREFLLPRAKERSFASWQGQVADLGGAAANDLVRHGGTSLVVVGHGATLVEPKQLHTGRNNARRDSVVIQS